MSGLLSFWDARLVITSPWNIVHQQKNEYKEEINDVIPAKDLEIREDLC